MNGYKQYGIEPDQVYARVDGEPGRVVVRDVTTFAEVDDIIVSDEDGDERRIAAFQLARHKYYLVDFVTGEDRRSLVRALAAGEASPAQQKRLVELLLAQQRALTEQMVHARRGRFVVERGEWRYLDDKRDGMRTWLCARVAPDADLSCVGTRGTALDKALEAEKLDRSAAPNIPRG